MLVKLASVFLAGWLGCSVMAAAETPAPEFKAGFAVRDITPDIGMLESHAVARHFFKTFNDPCKLRVAVFDDGQRKVVLIGLDALMIPRSVVLQARAEIEKACGIKSDAIMIGASHSHSSGPVGVGLPGQFDGASEEVRRLAYEESSQADAGYLQRVIHEMVLGTSLANANCVPAKLGFGFGHESTVSFQRRLRMKNGRTYSAPAARSSEIVAPAGPIDPQVGVVGAWDLEGKLLGVIVNFACHATTNPGGISGNWPGAMEKTIQGALDTHAPVVYLAGSSGDVTQVDHQSPFARPDQATWRRQVGGRIGAEAVKVLLTLPASRDIMVDTRQRVWKIKRRAPAPERVAEARTIVRAGKPAKEMTNWTFARETLLLDYIISVEPEVEVEVQAIQVGPAVFLSNPAELFVQYGLEIKQGSPFKFTFPVELANGCVGYVPTEEAFSPSGGGYETRLTFYSNLDITAGRQFAETALSLAREMHPGPVPAFPRLPAGGRDWPFGNVPPQVK